MQELWLITKKNLKLLLRAKGSALIVIFAPLLIMLILGLSFNTTSKYGLNLGVYAPEFTADVNSVISLLEEQEFNIIKYTSSLEDCVKDLTSGVVHTCISLPLSLAPEGNTPKEITFHLDPSRINLVWMIQETLKTKFDFKSQEISQSLTQELLSKLADTKNKLGQKQGELNAIKDKNAAAAGSTDSVKSSLSSLDVSASTTVYNASSTTEATDKVKEGKGKVEEASSKVGSAQFADDSKATIESLLSDAEGSLGTAIGLLEQDSGTMSILIADLDATRAKLAAVSQAVSSSSATLDGASSSIKESSAALDGIIASLAEIQAALESQRVTEAGTIVQPLIVKIERIGGESTYLNYIFPALLVIVIMFSSLLLGTTLVMMEKNSPAFLRNFFLPVRKATFVISTYLTNLVLIVVQVVIILGLSLLFLPEVTASLIPLSLILFISASVFTFLGMAIGYVFVSEETGVLASISLGSLLLFLSGVIIPIESVSSAIRGIITFNPFVIAEKVIRGLMLFKTPLVDLKLELAILIGYALVLFLIILIIESVLHQHLIHRFMKHHHLRHRQREKMEKNKLTLP